MIALVIKNSASIGDLHATHVREADQLLGVFVLRSTKQRLSVALLYHLTRFHHYGVMTQGFDDVEIVTDKQIRQIVLFL